ncbi:DUF4037 domain-containing protein [Lederbergia citrea]|uniref:DUF4037 domain-containing protein n=1 Tax=Lederbergia citrea TaxID=2833581 RepID=A0A942ULU5_9BACI|nr:DUF4037 domain-containing protein [Lederbergia citrea]MBS4177654.1 DUF4037 domain-containing protein [Lederbergia citrea]MBS4223821.1 DUF4037 domain-containing protein [Lederbergia citrea]
MAFIKGIELSRRFYYEIIEQVISSNFPKLQYTSALIGPGSEVLGFDTEMSTDHDWGPRLFLFLQKNDMNLVNDIYQVLQKNIPVQFYGYTVDLKQTVITSLEQFIKRSLAIDIHKDIQLIDWLTFPSQVLAEIVGGEVFCDDTGQLTKLRKQLNYYPYDIWLFQMASIWNRIGQEEHLVLRSGYMGDELGSSIIGSRIVRDIMNLCFLMERQYAPYPKWFGTAFKGLKCADELLPMLTNAQSARTWREREDALCKVYEFIASKHNQLGITENMTNQVTFFYDRPFKVIQGGMFADVIARKITDSAIRKLSQKRLIGAIDQVTDNTDFRSINQWCTDEHSTERNIVRLLYNKILE